MPKYYSDAESSPDFPRLEEQVLQFWKERDIFRKSVEARPRDNEFVFYDGPPFANGLPHYGHLLTGFVKDAVARYQTMRGKRVERRFGWDCHGLPAEMGAEKDLNISGRQSILNYGIDRFNDYCRTSVMQYTHEWEYYVTRQARWVDFKNDYKTMDKGFMESVLWAFKQLYGKGFVYEAYRVMPYSWGAETPLSNFETRLDNAYREREDKAVTVAFELKEKPPGAPEADKYYILAWTTTPWTLPSNLALAVNREIEYATIVINRPPLEGGQTRREPSREGYQKQAGHRYDGGALQRAKELRKASTEAEQKLWSHLRDKQLENYKFRRQHPIGAFIADFYCAGAKLVIEIDGGQHNEKDTAAYDAERTIFLESSGYRVLRFWNNDVLQNIEGVMEKIAETVFTPPDSLRSSAPPQGGGGRICYILSEKALAFYTKEIGYGSLTEILLTADYKRLKGTNLLNLSYHPLFPYFADHPNSFRILDGSDFVTDADGTGIVHMAPGFGEDDQRVCEAAGIELVCPVDHAGRFTEEIYDLEWPTADGGRQAEEKTSAVSGQPPAAAQLTLRGLNVIAEPGGSKFGLANDRIIEWLKRSGHLIKQETITHNYPHCWRTDTPLIYRALPSWYVQVSAFRDRMVELNRQINWIPEHVKDGLFGKWLENARDWSISRNRFWGTPIPVWKSDNPKNLKLYVFGSIRELEEFFKVKVEDLHRPFIDALTAPDPEDARYTLRRVEDVFDCWFESGSMPYGQVHYPFENVEWFKTHAPADFIVEYMAQTRGWFYTLMVLSTALFDKPPFLNCICHGVVLDDKGRKLSKRLNNYADPKEIFNTFGADALRWFMLSSPVMRGSEMHIDKEGKFIRDVVRLAVKPIWNAYHFFCLYANADGVVASDKWQAISEKGTLATYHLPLATNVMDRYILAKCAAAVEAVRAAFDAYDTPAACEAVSMFFETLNNWYIRRNKERFWKEEKDEDKQAAYDTLYTVLTTMARAAAPLLPLTLEAIYKGLTDTLPPLPPGEDRGEGTTANPKPKTDPDMLDKARVLREGATDAEKLLWYNLRNRQLINAKFKRQQPIGPYIADFCCHEARLIVELDGGQHASQQEKDQKREAFLKTQGYSVLRFWNNEVLQNLEGVLQVIAEHLAKAAPSPQPSPGGRGSISVHLTDFPDVSGFFENTLENQLLLLHMDRIRDVCNTALAMRNKINIRVRQPLNSLTIVSNTWRKPQDADGLALLALVEDEVNVKKVKYEADIDSYATLKLSLNNPVLGKRLPEKMKQIIPTSKKGEWKKTPDDGVEICGEKLLPEEYSLLLEPKPEYKDRAQALSTNDALVILDTTITPELEAEGIARDCVRLIQQARKDAGLHVSDHIALALEADSAIAKAVEAHRQYVMEQTLAVSLTLGAAEGEFIAENSVDGNHLVIALSRIADQAKDIA